MAQKKKWLSIIFIIISFILILGGLGGISSEDFLPGLIVLFIGLIFLLLSLKNLLPNLITNLKTKIVFGKNQRKKKIINEKSWFKQHKILSGIMGFLLLIIGMSLFANIINEESNTGSSQSSAIDNIITTNSKSFLPQESEIDRIWTLGSYDELKINDSEFIEGTEFEITKREDFSVTRVIMEIYRFESDMGAQSYYNQKISIIDIRGVEELNLGNDCFGIDREVGFSGYAEGCCLRNNLVIYLKSNSNSFFYVSDFKDYLKIILNKLKI